MEKNDNRINKDTINNYKLNINDVYLFEDIFDPDILEKIHDMSMDALLVLMVYIKGLFNEYAKKPVVNTEQLWTLSRSFVILLEILNDRLEEFKEATILECIDDFIRSNKKI